MPSRCPGPECDREIGCKGLCIAHYQQQQRGQDLRPLRSYRRGASCSYPGCKEAHYARNLCGGHWQQQHEGRPLQPLRPRRPSTCTFRDCDEPHSALGYCTGHYQQHRAGWKLRPLKKVIPLPERIEALIERDGPDSCWIWLGALSSDGYGRTRDESQRQVMVHRAVFEHYVEPIPDGYFVTHICTIRECCNPAHLQLATDAEVRVLLDLRGRRGVTYRANAEVKRDLVAHLALHLPKTNCTGIVSDCICRTEREEYDEGSGLAA